MKKTSAFISFVVLPMVAFTVQANSGTISFAGKITDSTCTVSVDGQGADATINLPTVSKTALAADGETAGRTGFNITFTDCTMGCLLIRSHLISPALNISLAIR